MLGYFKTFSVRRAQLGTEIIPIPAEHIEHFQACSGNNPEICDGQGFDVDCDGRIDCDDPDCGDDPNCDVYARTANAEAAALGSNFLTGSGVSNELLLLLIPIATIIVLMILRRKNSPSEDT